jgi:hypothetical protein
MTRPPAPDALIAAYKAQVARDAATGRECLHGNPSGDLVRPGPGTPACPWCRRRDPVRWRRLPP